ncbi:hypothetical protein RvY_08751-2 [Ramazzottius varieornatus]|uniref:Uncharacterized protein n=1 Tax=Ramazzottius varieornatus TaxID=947166 RepID=A0A1D1VEZ2_RAMVA|nr:hypothetical protein RvY_08751-2 [Ramazzottius varieornatus]
MLAIPLLRILIQWKVRIPTSLRRGSTRGVTQSYCITRAKTYWRKVWCWPIATVMFSAPCTLGLEEEDNDGLRSRNNRRNKKCCKRLACLPRTPATNTTKVM